MILAFLVLMSFNNGQDKGALVAGLACENDHDCIGFDPKCESCLKETKTCGCNGNFDPDADGWGCFSAKATVRVLDSNKQGVSEVTMDKVFIGDMVLTADDAFEPVYAFGHFNSNKVSDFVQIYTKGNKKPLEMTINHLVFAANKAHPVTADSLQVGDLVYSGSSNTPVVINKIKSTVRKDGVFAPLTPSGTILVDGVLASTYVSMQTQNYPNDDGEYPRMANGMLLPLISQQLGIHMATSFFRMLCMGVMASACGDDPANISGDTNTSKGDGLIFWADYGIRLATFVQTRSVIVQWLLLVVALVVVTPVYAMEVAFGARYAPLIVFALAISGLFLSSKKNLFNSLRGIEMSKKAAQKVKTLK